MADAWGPLGPLVGDWEAEGGLDTAYCIRRVRCSGLPTWERVTFKPFGPVDNGSQSLYGLDYKTAMWCDDEENPFHTEVGNDDGSWTYDETTMLQMKEFDEPFAHTDHNTLRRVS